MEKGIFEGLKFLYMVEKIERYYLQNLRSNFFIIDPETIINKIYQKKTQYNNKRGALMAE